MASDAGERGLDAGREAFGRLLRETRRQQGLSQAALGKASRISPVFVSQIETGQRVPSDRVAKALAVALGLPYREVLRSVYLLRSQEAHDVLALAEGGATPVQRTLSEVPAVRFLLMQLATLDLSEADVEALVQRWSQDVRFLETQLARLQGR
jgi:transcriptional regulator with XRE-family HTH domain